MIENRKYSLTPGSLRAPGGLARAVEAAIGGEALRWFISRSDAAAIEVEVAECTGLPALPALPAPPATTGRAVVINLVPTGIGCTFGGFAGDAAPVTALLGAAADLVVTNPNAVNASNFILAGDQVVYTEGYSMNLFATGATALHRPRANRIGVIIERADDAALDEVFNVVNTARAVYGVEIADCLVTDGPIGAHCVRSDSGAYGGRIEHPDTLLAAGRRLVDAGATALAVTTNVRGLPAADYARHFHGAHPNPVGGAEAVVSHLLTRILAVPSAHAPMMNFKDVGSARVVDARAAGEFVSTSGLACVLIGLRRAPQLAPRPGCPTTEVIGVGDVVAVVAPATALGSASVLSAVARGTPVIAVRENETVLGVTAEALGLGDAVIEVDSYLAASGLVLALRNGIGLDSLRRPLATLGMDRVRATSGSRPVSAVPAARPAPRRLAPVGHPAVATEANAGSSRST